MSKRIVFFMMFSAFAFAQNDADRVENSDDADQGRFIGPAQVQDRWNSQSACEAALQSGSYRVYQPTYFNHHRNLRQGETSAPPEHTGCALMQVVGGYRYVIVPGAETDKPVFLIWKAGPGGILTPIARQDCGNLIRSFHYPPPPQVTPPPGRLVCVTKRGYDKINGQHVEIPQTVKLESFTFDLSDGQKTATGGETRHACFANPGIIGQKYAVTEEPTDPNKWRPMTSTTVEFVLEPGEGEYTVEFKNEQVTDVTPAPVPRSCSFTGGMSSGFSGGAKGDYDSCRITVDGKEVASLTHEQCGQVSGFVPPNPAPGTHDAQLDVIKGGQVVDSCKQAFDVYSFTPTVTAYTPPPPTPITVDHGTPWWHYIPCIPYSKKTILTKTAVCGVAAGLAWWLWPTELVKHPAAAAGSGAYIP